MMFTSSLPLCAQPVTGKCGDGICDDFEKNHPDVCPQDCSGDTSRSARPIMGKCGDGICDDFEKKHPNVCPQDCGHQTDSAPRLPDAGSPPVMSEPPTLKVSSVQRPVNESPFGVFGPYGYEMDPGATVITRQTAGSYLKDLGASWVQVRYWEEIDVPAGISVYSRIGGEAHVDSSNITDAYRSALRNVIRTYKGQIKYWEVGTEPSGFPPPRGWKDNPQSYAVFLRESYSIIKQECGDCKVVFGGLSGVGAGLTEDWPSARFLREVLAAGGGKYIDAFEFKQHHYMAKDYRIIKKRMDVYRKLFSEVGIDLKRMPVFLETATHDGAPSEPAGSLLSKIPLAPQTESEQAAGLFRIYIYSIAQGIDKVFWNLLIERYNFGGNPGSDFNHYGLIHNEKNERLSHRKLAFFTFKKMTEILDGADWKGIQIVQDQDDLFLCRIPKKGHVVWAAWSDRQNVRPMIVSGITSAAVVMTTMVPTAATGKNVIDYARSFLTERLHAVSGKVTIQITNIPVLLEEVP
jgi:hypothetical protein